MLAPLASLQTPSASNPSQARGLLQTAPYASARSARRFHAARIGVRLADDRTTPQGARLATTVGGGGLLCFSLAPLGRRAPRVPLGGSVGLLQPAAKPTGSALPSPAYRRQTSTSPPPLACPPQARPCAWARSTRLAPDTVCTKPLTGSGIGADGVFRFGSLRSPFPCGTYRCQAC